MAYLLPRTILVVIAWGVTCALIEAHLAFGRNAGLCDCRATWLAAGVAYFGYLNKLRRDIVRLEGVPAATPTSGAAAELIGR